MENVRYYAIYDSVHGSYLRTGYNSESWQQLIEKFMLLMGAEYTDTFTQEVKTIIEILDENNFDKMVSFMNKYDYNIDVLSVPFPKLQEYDEAF